MSTGHQAAHDSPRPEVVKRDRRDAFRGRRRLPETNLGLSSNEFDRKALDRGFHPGIASGFGASGEAEGQPNGGSLGPGGSEPRPFRTKPRRPAAIILPAAQSLSV